MTLLSAPLELGGEWGGSPPNDALAVISRMREVCLSGVMLLSDRGCYQPLTIAKPVPVQRSLSAVEIS